jgi:hypothetical protein
MDKEPEDDDQGDQGHNPKFQDASKTVNVIFGGWRLRFQAGRKTASPGDHVRQAGGTTTTPLVGGAHLVLPWAFWSPVNSPWFWTPVVAEVRLTKVIFANTLRKMGLDFTDMLVPSKSPFYGIVPGNAAHPLGTVVLPDTFGRRENYRIEFITFEVANFESSYHAILGHPALAKFMAVPHYVYLLL